MNNGIMVASLVALCSIALNKISLTVSLQAWKLQHCHDSYLKLCFIQLNRFMLLHFWSIKFQIMPHSWQAIK